MRFSIHLPGGSGRGDRHFRDQATLRKNRLCRDTLRQHQPGSGDVFCQQWFRSGPGNQCMSAGTRPSGWRKTLLGRTDYPCNQWGHYILLLRSGEVIQAYRLVAVHEEVVQYHGQGYEEEARKGFIACCRLPQYSSGTSVRSGSSGRGAGDRVGTGSWLF